MNKMQSQSTNQQLGCDQWRRSFPAQNSPESRKLWRSLAAQGKLLPFQQKEARSGWLKSNGEESSTSQALDSKACWKRLFIIWILRQLVLSRFAKGLVHSVWTACFQSSFKIWPQQWLSNCINFPVLATFLWEASWGISTTGENICNSQNNVPVKNSMT